MFFAQLCGDHGYIHVPANRMELNDNLIYAYYDDVLTAVVDVSVVLFAHVSERRRPDNGENYC